jgi:hypothetical protein
MYFVNPNRGHFIFKDLWLENFVLSKGHLYALNKDKIQKIAQDFLTDADKKVRESQSFKVKQIPPLFANLVFWGIEPIGTEDKITSYKVVFVQFVNPNTETDKVPVVDSSVAIEVGLDGSIFGVYYEMLPIQRLSSVPQISYETSVLGNIDKPCIIYKTEVSLNVLAPYLGVYVETIPENHLTNNDKIIA